MTSTARVTWVDGMQFVGESGSGHDIELSEQKYCSASAMLARTADISYTYQIIQESVE